MIMVEENEKRMNLTRYQVTGRLVSTGRKIFGMLSPSGRGIATGHNKDHRGDDIYLEVYPDSVEPLALPAKHEPHAVGDKKCPCCNAAFFEGAGRFEYCGNCGQRVRF